MHFLSLISGFVALASLTLGFDLPDNAPYGEYLIPILSNGTQSGEAILIKAGDVFPISASAFKDKGRIMAQNMLPYSSINCSWRPVTASAYNGVRDVSSAS
jgi:hypothetical protein